MAADFTKRNPELERRLARCTSSQEIQNLLQGLPVEEVSPEPAAPALSQPVVRIKDGKAVLIQTDFNFKQ